MKLAAIACCLIALLPDSVAAASPQTGAARAADKSAQTLTEQYERDVDQVASASQENAIAKLSALLKKYRGTRQEATLLVKLADLQQQHAAILFRIAHGRAHRGKDSVDLTRYSKAMKASIATLTALIDRYPDHDEISRAYYMRAKAHEETSAKAKAIADYEHIIKAFPKAEETPSAYMALAGFAIDANDHPKAIRFLSEIEKLPEDPHYPFALYKLAWSWYNLKNIPRSISFAERHLEYYRERAKQAGEQEGAAAAGLATSDTALVENMLLDSVVFFFEGYEQGHAQFRLAEARPFFRKLESGPSLGKMLVRFTKLLRSRGHDADLIIWKDDVLQAESDRPEALDVVLVTYEYQLQKRRYAQLIESSRDIVKLYEKHHAAPGFAAPLKEAQKLIIETAEGLQAIILKNKGAEEVKGLSRTLASIYDSFTKVVDDSDPRVPKVHYNLAETLFAIKDFPGATAHYRWVVDHARKWDSDASLKAIASRYEVLVQKQLVGGDVSARSLKENVGKALDPLLEEWVDWIDLHASKAVKGEKGGDNFVFEAHRALYARGHVLRAVDRLKKFADRQPSSTFAVPAASLVLDTFVAGGDWQKTHDLALEFSRRKEWKGTAFEKRLTQVVADSAYKMIESQYNAKSYAEALQGVEKFLKLHPESPRRIDCLGLGGRIGLATNDSAVARKYFSSLIESGAKSESVGEALLARASLLEKGYEYAAAAQDFRAYLALPDQMRTVKADQLEQMRRKALLLTWLVGDLGELRSVLESKLICTPSLAEECERMQALSLLASPDQAGSEKVTELALERAKKASEPNRIVWAALALEGVKHLIYRDRMSLLRQIASGWNDVEPIARYALVPHLSVTIPKTFRLNRLSINDIAPLRANEKYITRRIEVLREIENATTKVMKLPWARIRAESLSELASLYVDLSAALTRLPPPKGLEGADLASYEETIKKLVLPFEEKGQELRAKAFEIASRSAIEESSLQAVATPFFTENPSQAKKYQVPMPKSDAAAPDLGVELLVQLDGPGFAKSAPAQEPGTKLRNAWRAALYAKRWPQVAFWMQEAIDKNIIAPGVVSAMKAVAFSVAGARAEGWMELDAARKSLSLRGRLLVTLSRMQSCLRSYDRPKAEELFKELQTEQLTLDDATFVASASGALGFQFVMSQPAAGGERAPATPAGK